MGNLRDAAVLEVRTFAWNWTLTRQHLLAYCQGRTRRRGRGINLQRKKNSIRVSHIFMLNGRHRFTPVKKHFVYSGLQKYHILGPSSCPDRYLHLSSILYLLQEFISLLSVADLSLSKHTFPGKAALTPAFIILIQGPSGSEDVALLSYL